MLYFWSITSPIGTPDTCIARPYANTMVTINIQTSEDVFKLGYEEKFYDFLTDCVVEVERRIKRNKMRLDQTNGGRQQEDTPVSRYDGRTCTVQLIHT